MPPELLPSEARVRFLGGEVAGDLPSADAMLLAWAQWPKLGRLAESANAQVPVITDETVEAPGIEPGSENEKRPPPTCVADTLNRPGSRLSAGSTQG